MAPKAMPVDLLPRDALVIPREMYSHRRIQASIGNIMRGFDEAPNKVLWRHATRHYTLKAERRGNVWVLTEEEGPEIDP